MVCALSASVVWQLAAALGALALLAVLRRRHLPGPTPLSLTRDHRLHVVELDGQRLLVGTSPGCAPSLLCRLGDPSPGPAMRGGPGGSDG